MCYVEEQWVETEVLERIYKACRLHASSASFFDLIDLLVGFKQFKLRV